MVFLLLRPAACDRPRVRFSGLNIHQHLRSTGGTCEVVDTQYAMLKICTKCTVFLFDSGFRADHWAYALIANRATTHRCHKEPFQHVRNECGYEEEKEEVHGVLGLRRCMYLALTKKLMTFDATHKNSKSSSF
jgi:hypothetical protein